MLGFFSLNLSSDAIYFDGYLPLYKQKTRLQRLENSRRELLDFKAKYADGVPILPATYRFTSTSATAYMPLDSPLPRSNRYNGIPAAPFFVASIIETLLESKYAALTDVVPGEADTFCAAAARKADRGALIFTNDSDLLVHDLGPERGVVFLKQIEFITDDGKTNHSRTSDTIRARCFWNHNIAQRLGIDNCKRLVFEIKYDPSTTLKAAIKRAKRPLSDASALTEFLSEFDPELLELGPPQQDHHLKPDRQMNRYLDPRVSELVLQVTEKISVELIYIYLPALIEDPDRASAWNNTTEDRAFTYSCLQYYIPANVRIRLINEVFRKGDRIATTQIPLLSKSDTSEYARRLLQRIQDHQKNIREKGMAPYGFWRSYAVSRVTGSEPSTEAFQSVFRGEGMASFWSWRDVQLTAQIEAVLYSLRILKQLLRYLVVNGASLPKPMIGLDQALATLPPLKIMMATRLEVLQRGESES